MFATPCAPAEGKRATFTSSAKDTAWAARRPNRDGHIVGTVGHGAMPLADRKTCPLKAGTGREPARPTKRAEGLQPPGWAALGGRNFTAACGARRRPAIRRRPPARGERQARPRERTSSCAARRLASMKEASRRRSLRKKLSPSSAQASMTTTLPRPGAPRVKKARAGQPYFVHHPHPGGLWRPSKIAGPNAPRKRASRAYARHLGRWIHRRPRLPARSEAAR